MLYLCRLSRAFSPLPPTALAWDHVELSRPLLDAVTAYPRVRSLLAGVCSATLEEKTLVVDDVKYKPGCPSIPSPFSFHLFPSLHSCVLDLNQISSTLDFAPSSTEENQQRMRRSESELNIVASSPPAVSAHQPLAAVWCALHH